MTGSRRTGFRMVAITALWAAATMAPVSASDHGTAFEFPGHDRLGPGLEQALAGRAGMKHAAPTPTVLHGATDGASLVQAVRDAGAAVQSVSGNLVQASLSADQVRRLAGHPAVAHMRLPLRAAPDAVVSEALPDIAATRFRDSGFRGQGTRIAVLDIGFGGYSGRLGGELPATIEVRNFNHEGFETTSHGTAVAEIIHDMAPEAEITLVSFLTDVEFMEALEWIQSRQPKIHVVNASIGFTNVGPLNGASAITRAADRMLEEHGILYVNSAGNEQQRQYSGEFQDPDGNGWHNFSASDEFMDLTLNGQADMEITLNWDDWGDNPSRPASTRNLDLYIWCPGTESSAPEDACFSSTAPQFGGSFDRPLERILGESAEGGEYRLGIRRTGGVAPDRMHLSFAGEAVNSFEYRNTESTLNLPADGTSVLAVGAFDHEDPAADYRKNVRFSDPGFSIEDWQAELPPQNYSSLGPTWDGRHKPDISGPDCVSTATFGTGGFCGTSAAAPHVTAAAALLKSEVPERSGAALRRLLLATAEDVKPLGVDDAHGAGRVNLSTAADKPGLSTRSGLWNSPLQNGHGFFMEARAGRLIVLWYVYDRNGEPVWLMSTGSMTDDAHYSGRVLSFRGPGSIASPLGAQFDAAGTTSSYTDVGAMNIHFTGDARAQVSLSLQGDELVPAGQYDVEVTQFLIAPPASDSGLAYASAFSGLWQLPSQNGHGFIVNRQGYLRSPSYQNYPTDRLLVAWFGYAGVQGQPFWVLGSGPMDGADTFDKAGKVIGDRVIQSYEGPTLDGNEPLSQQFDLRGRTVHATRNGSFAMKFLSPTDGEIRFDTQGGSISETLPVERLDF